jgi:predicted RNA-binding protein associated with RNAse of E/G family
VVVAEIVTVHKLSYRGEFITSWQGEVVERTPAHLLLRARWERAPTPVEHLVFEPGDLFLEYYYARRPYSLWGVYTADGTRLKGWYCNVCEPVDLDGSVLKVRDLLLDVLVSADGRQAVLDRDEFAAATDLPAGLAALAEAAVVEIQDLVARRATPFDGLRAES